MASKKKPSRAVVTPEFRMSHPHLAKAHSYQEDGAEMGIPSYQVEGLFLPDSLQHFHIFDESKNSYVDVNLPTLLVELAKEAWGADFDVKAAFEAQKDKHGDPGKGWPIKNGDAKKKRGEAKGKPADHYAGVRVLGMHSAIKTRDGKPLVAPVLSMNTGAGKFATLKRDSEVDMAKAEQIFDGSAGSYAFATISIVASEISGVKFLTPYLNGIRWTRSGDRIGGQSEMDRFSGYTGGAAPHDPTAGMDTEIAF